MSDSQTHVLTVIPMTVEQALEAAKSYSSPINGSMVDVLARALTAAQKRIAELEGALNSISAPADFVMYCVNNLPSGTIVTDPEWWAHRLWRQAARAALSPPKDVP